MDVIRETVEKTLTKETEDIEGIFFFKADSLLESAVSESEVTLASGA